ncbi:hypothetical protein BAE44_0003154 [Dichanthelium oligosanthes]|uniref:Uncharacterized protein n=1 Tax=Dichanthelium oligosanthes TaxID=888268 RepID=A0A1E5WEL8_9POAL|nr:hypothetical protein BAE44_0003154 [Dichanthelium oligosanthes]
MGNAVPPRMCRKEAGTAAGTTVARRRPSNVATEDAPRRAAVTPRKRRGDAEQEEGTTRAGLHRHAGAVPWVGGVGADDAVGKASAATVATVKIVLKRKDAEALVARLNAQGARERKARMAELKGELRASRSTHARTHGEMGNTGWRRSRNDVVTEAAAAPAAPTRAVVTARKQRRDDDVEEEEQTMRAGRRRPRCAARGVSRAGGGDGGATSAGAVVTVKVVMTRKDADALVARLNAQSARVRKARMAELKGELRAGGCGGGGGASPALCRDAYWSPQLAPIKEK